MKTCSKCREPKSMDDFHRQRNAPDGRRYWCKPCVRKYYTKGREVGRDKIRTHNLKKRFGMTQDDYEALLESQDGKCAICASLTPQTVKTEFFSIDHDHETDRVRGLLCELCNRGLGQFKDNYELLLRAADYLRTRDA